MNMNNSQDLINGIKSWALGDSTILKGLSTHPIENWFYHAYALFTGTEPSPVSDFFHAERMMILGIYRSVSLPILAFLEYTYGWKQVLMERP